jgi:hypothetical protein
MRLTFICVLLGLLASACGAPPDEGSAGDDSESVASDLTAAGGARYADVEESFTSDQDWERWFQLTRALREDFDQICGDTFCEGDFSNLQALRFRCSVATGTGQLKSCLWLFAGSYETVTPSTGNIRPTARFFHCKIPVQGTPAQMTEALLAPGGERPLWRPLPVTGKPIYDTLIDCL